MRPLVVFGSLAFSALALAACKGGGGAAPVPTPSGAGNSTAFVANNTGNTVTGYAPYQQSPKITITSGVTSPFALAVDSSGNLYVANCPPCVPGGAGVSSITEYARNGTVPTRTITSGILDPDAIAVDALGNLYVANGGAVGSASSVVVYSGGATAPSRTIVTGVSQPIALAVDGSENIYVANTAPSNGTVTVYSSTGALLRTLVATGLVEGVAVDRSANVYVASCSATCLGGAVADAVIVFGANSSTVKYSVSNGISFPTIMAFDGANHLYVANDAQGAGNDVTEYANGSGALIATISAPGPAGIAVDASGIAYIADGVGPGGIVYDAMTEYKAGGTTTVTTGINGAAAVATSTTPAPSASP